MDVRCGRRRRCSERPGGVSQVNEGVGGWRERRTLGLAWRAGWRRFGSRGCRRIGGDGWWAGAVVVWEPLSAPGASSVRPRLGPTSAGGALALHWLNNEVASLVHHPRLQPITLSLSSAPPEHPLSSPLF